MFLHSFKCPKCKGEGKVDGDSCHLCRGDGTYLLKANDEKKALKMEKLIKTRLPVHEKVSVFQ